MQGVSHMGSTSPSWPPRPDNVVVDAEQGRLWQRKRGRHDVLLRSCSAVSSFSDDFCLTDWCFKRQKLRTQKCKAWDFYMSSGDLLCETRQLRNQKRRFQEWCFAPSFCDSGCHSTGSCPQDVVMAMEVDVVADKDVHLVFRKRPRKEYVAKDCKRRRIWKSSGAGLAGVVMGSPFLLTFSLGGFALGVVVGLVQHPRCQ